MFRPDQRHIDYLLLGEIIAQGSGWLCCSCRLLVGSLGRGSLGRVVLQVLKDRDVVGLLCVVGAARQGVHQGEGIVLAGPLGLWKGAGLIVFRLPSPKEN